MAHWEDNQNEEFENGLSEIEQMQLDAVLLETAYNNSYLVLTDQITFEDLLAKKFKSGHEAVMAYDPCSGPKECELDNMLSYYIDLEEYERCAKIRDILQKTYPKTIKE